MRAIKLAEGAYINVAILAAIAIVLGLTLIFFGTRKRDSLDVPLMSNHAKLFTGGTLLILGICVLAFIWLKTSM